MGNITNSVCRRPPLLPSELAAVSPGVRAGSILSSSSSHCGPLVPFVFITSTAIRPNGLRDLFPPDGFDRPAGAGLGGKRAAARDGAPNGADAAAAATPPTNSLTAAAATAAPPGVAAFATMTLLPASPPTATPGESGPSLATAAAANDGLKGRAPGPYDSHSVAIIKSRMRILIQALSFAMPSGLPR